MGMILKLLDSAITVGFCWILKRQIRFSCYEKKISKLLHTKIGNLNKIVEKELKKKYNLVFNTFL